MSAPKTQSAERGWPKASLTNLGTLLSGQSPPSTAVNREGEGTVYVSGPEQWDGHKVHVDKWTTEPKRIAPPGAIFITVKGAGVGKIFPGVEGAIGRDIYAFVPDRRMSPRYVEHALRHSVQDVLRHAVGDIPGLSRKHILDHEIPVPPLGVQEEIVAEIEKQFSRLDEAVTNLKRVKANLKRYKAAILKAAIEGRLVPNEAELARREGRAYESAHELLQRVLSERSQQWQGKHREPSGATAESTESLPDGWCWCTIEQLGEVGTGATPSRSNSSYWLDGDVAWVSSAAVNEPYVDAASEFVSRKALSETNLTLYPPGTLLVAMYGEGKTRGRCTELRIPATTNQAIAALNADSRVRPYLKLFLEHNYEELRKVASGGVQPNLNLRIIRAVRVPLPPLVEQRRIVVDVDRCLSVVSEIEREVDLGKLRTSRLRQAVLSVAIGGRS